jgi:putative nucleotidyltransferase with HDIG domain
MAAPWAAPYHRVTLLLPPFLLDHQPRIDHLERQITRLDAATGDHSRQVAELAAAVAEQLGLPDPEVEAVRVVGLVHDVGKVAIDARVLAKPGPLAPEEWRVVKRHPEVGEQLVRETLGLGADAAAAVRHHHERFDGAGYPDGLAGEEIPLAARIVAVVDAFDAMTSDRPYRRALSPGQARAEVARCAGSHFCPDVVAAFLNATSISEAA